LNHGGHGDHRAAEIEPKLWPLEPTPASPMANRKTHAFGIADKTHGFAVADPPARDKNRGNSRLRIAISAQAGIQRPSKTQSQKCYVL